MTRKYIFGEIEAYYEPIDCKYVLNQYQLELSTYSETHFLLLWYLDSKFVRLKYFRNEDFDKLIDFIKFLGFEEVKAIKKRGAKVK